jgi:hypothetical protein
MSKQRRTTKMITKIAQSFYNNLVREGHQVSKVGYGGVREQVIGSPNPMSLIRWVEKCEKSQVFSLRVRCPAFQYLYELEV